MNKTYFNNGIVGNSRMLGCITDKGELTRLFWPNIDYQQHFERIYTGIFFMDQKHSTSWLHEDDWQHSQSYMKDTNILKTVCTYKKRQITVEQVDFVLLDRDVLVRQYTIENTGENVQELGFMLYSECISTTPELGSTLFEFGSDALIHYKHGAYISLSSNEEVWQFQIGNNAYEASKGTFLTGHDSIGMIKDGALSWKLGKLNPKEKKGFTLYITAADTFKGIKKLALDTKALDIKDEYHKTEGYWKEFLLSARPVKTGREEVDGLYKRSLLVFKLMSDEKTGGLLAAPEVDEAFTKCGRYAYCWGRDAAFITNAMDKSGLSYAVEKFYYWAMDIQDEDGGWQQRYHMDGNLAPSWGMQIDETGTLIWGMLKHYENTKSKAFLERAWGSVKKGVEFLIGYRDKDTGLPKPSYDLWEERLGEHTYSAASVYGGIAAGVEIAGILGYKGQEIDYWTKVARDLKEAMIKYLWKEDFKRFIRSIRVKLNPWGSEHGEGSVILKVNQKGYERDFTLEDWIVDVSLLGVCVPFGVFGAEEDKVASTAALIEKVLTNTRVGGIKRYENDNYIGGNPWVLTTLWVALYHIEKKEFKKAKEYFEWAVNARTALDLLPEQINKDTGKPAWVIPLTWSHAMFVLVLFGLIEVGEL